MIYVFLVNIYSHIILFLLYFLLKQSHIKLCVFKLLQKYKLHKIHKIFCAVYLQLKLQTVDHLILLIVILFCFVLFLDHLASTS